ncbi:MAG: hypothetical protein HC880_18305, partial [Bacteroidia bacterium]|nr:hypothetical protein [Bacteroidia bacterium]
SMQLREDASLLPLYQAVQEAFEQLGYTQSALEAQLLFVFLESYEPFRLESPEPATVCLFYSIDL